jgi:type I restriction enzyme S subunit
MSDDCGEWTSTTLPDSWEWVPFRSLCDDVTDSARKLPQNSYAQSGKFPVIDQGAEFIGGYTDNRNLVHLHEPPFIIFGDHTRCVKFVDFPFVQGADGVKTLKPRAGVEPRYLYHALRAIALPDKGYSRHMRFLRASSFPVCALPEQARVVARLDSLLAGSKTARDELAHIAKLVERYKQGILKKAFSGELTAKWRCERTGISHSRDEIRAAILSERERHRVTEGVRPKGANRNIPFDIAQLPDIPRVWAWITFEECCWDLTVGHVGPMKDRYASSGIPFLRSLNVKQNRIDLADIVYIGTDFDDELRKSRLKSGTVVVVRTGAPGVAAVIPPELDGANCSDLVICRPVNSVDPHYAAYFINSAFAQSVVTGFQVGVAQQHFNIGAMSKLQLPYAPPDEQHEIVRRITMAFARIDQVASDAERSDELLDRLDQAILAKAFRGELTTDDPTEEQGLESVG